MKRRFARFFFLFICLVLSSCVSLGRAQQVERLIKAEFERLGLGQAAVEVKVGLTDATGSSVAFVTLTEEQKANPLFDYGEPEVDDRLAFDFLTAGASVEEDLIGIRENLVSEVYDLHALVSSVNRQAYHADKFFLDRLSHTYDIDVNLEKMDRHMTASLTRLHELGVRVEPYRKQIYHYDIQFEPEDLDEAISILTSLMTDGYFTVRAL